MERIEACEGFEVLQARGKGSRWAVYRDARECECDACGAKVTTYRIEHAAGVDGHLFYSRIVCPTHVVGVTVPRVIGADIEGVPAPRPGSPGALRMADLASRGAA
jgi:hypothetical protein